MKNVILVCSALALLASCGEPVQKTVIKNLQKDNNHLVSAVASKNQQVESLKSHLNDIHENIKAIRVKESLVGEMAANGELKSNPESVFADLRSISDLINVNKDKIASLSDDLKLTKGELKEYAFTIDLLNEQLNDRSVKLKEMIDLLAERDIAIASLEEFQFDLLCEIDAMTLSENQVFFAYGTFDELSNNEVVEKRGGLLGLGANKVMKANFNRNYFTASDQREVCEIPLLCEKAQLASLHPSNSYEFIGEEGDMSLKITDPDSFWSTTKYLTIIVK